MRPNIRTAVSTIVLTTALAVSLSACQDGSGTPAGRPDSSASSPRDAGTSTGGSSGQDDSPTGSPAGDGGTPSDSAAGSSNSSGGIGKGDSKGSSGTVDTTQHAALPLPEGAKATSARTREDNVLVLRYKPHGSVQDVRDTYIAQLLRSGYEVDGGGVSRGEQMVNVGVDGGMLQISLTYPDVAPPLPPEARLRTVTSRSNDTLVLTYDKAPDEISSLSTLKTYAGQLSDAGWHTPTDSGTTCTKGKQKIRFGATSDQQLKVEVSVPSSVG